MFGVCDVTAAPSGAQQDRNYIGQPFGKTPHCTRARSRLRASFAFANCKVQNASFRIIEIEIAGKRNARQKESRNRRGNAYILILLRLISIGGNWTRKEKKKKRIWHMQGPNRVLKIPTGHSTHTRTDTDTCSRYHLKRRMFLLFILPYLAGNVSRGAHEDKKKAETSRRRRIYEIVEKLNI